MKTLERLFEREGLPLFGLPAALTATYGGDFGAVCELRLVRGRSGNSCWRG